MHHDKLFSCTKFCSYNWICGIRTKLIPFIFIERASDMHSKMCNVLIDMRTDGGDNIWIVLIWFWNWKINLCIFHITTQTHISKVAMNNLMMDMHTLLTFPRRIMIETYDYHVAWQYLYMSKINNWTFNQTFCFVYYRLYIDFFSKNAHAMIISMNACFWQICNTHTHTWLCIER